MFGGQHIALTTAKTVPSGMLSHCSLSPDVTSINPNQLAEHAAVGYFCLKTVSPHDNLHCEEIDFDPTLMEETIEKAQIFFKLVVAHELLLVLVPAAWLYSI